MPPSVTLTGAISNGGSISLLGGGLTDSSSLRVGVSTAAAGAHTGTAVINLTSDGTGTSGLGTTSLTPQTVTVSGNVYRLCCGQCDHDSG